MSGRDERGADGAGILAWARRHLAPDDVERVVEPAVADWRHEVATAPAGDVTKARARGRWAVLRAIVGVVVAERAARARAVPWWLLAFPALAVGLGTLALGTGQAASQAVFMGLGALAFALVATTPARAITPRWAWTGVALLGAGVAFGLSAEGATRWLAVGSLKVQVTMLALPLVVIGGRWPAVAASALLALAPDALGAGVVALAVPHPLTLVGAVVALVREPAMTIDAPSSVLAALALAGVGLAAWRWRMLPEGRVVLALIGLGAVAHALGHAPLPLVGYGGSAVVAVCLGFALAVARRGGWTPETPVG